MTTPTEPEPGATLDDVIEPTESAPRDRQEHGKAPARPDDDELAHRAELERDRLRRDREAGAAG